MKNDIEVGQIRAYQDKHDELLYVVVEFNQRHNLVKVKWLHDGSELTYSKQSTLNDRVLSELERELL